MRRRTAACSPAAAATPPSSCRRAASIGPARGRRQPTAIASAASRAGDGRPTSRPRSASTSRLPPAVTASDAFFEFLFSKAPSRYDELKRRAEAREPLPSFRLDGVTLTFNVDADYDVVRTQLTQNVVGDRRGQRSELKDTYVAFGAHYDHVGYAEGEPADGRRPAAPGRVTPRRSRRSHLERRRRRRFGHRGADGAGARRSRDGPRPKRSLLFVWHAGEERGLLGFALLRRPPDGADRPDRRAAEHRHDRPEPRRQRRARRTRSTWSAPIASAASCTRSTATPTARCDTPLTLDYEMNDPADLEQLYYRSDHYSYAAKGIPIIFFTTGLHPDYHANTDEVSKIEFDKMTRVTQLVYETGARLANLDHAPARDNTGPARGKGYAISDASAAHHLPHHLRQPGRLRHHHSAAAVLRGDASARRRSPSACCSRVFSLCQLIASPMLGDLSDRYGRRPVLIFSLAGTVVSFVMLALAQSIAMLFLARIVDGLSGGNISTARAYVADVTEPKDRARAYGMIGAAFGLGFILGPALSGVLAQVSYTAPIWAAAGITVVATVMAWFWLPETVHRVTASARACRFRDLAR